MGTAFGFRNVSIEDDDDDGQEEVVETEGQEPESPEPHEPALDTAPAVLPKPGDEGYLWAAKYQSPEELERGYREANAALTQRAQALAAETARREELEEALRNALPYIEAGLTMQRQRQAPGTPEGFGDDEVDFSDPEAIQRLIDQKVQERLQPIVQQQDQARQMAEFNAAATRTIEEWQRLHPDAANTAVEDEMVRIIGEHRLNVTDLDQVELAYDIWKNPGIADALKANPARATSPEGRSEARMIGQQFSAQAAGGPGTAGTPPAKAPIRPRPTAFVETGGSGAPVTGKGPGQPAQEKDAFDEVLDLLKNSRQTPFGVRVLKD